MCGAEAPRIAARGGDCPEPPQSPPAAPRPFGPRSPHFFPALRFLRHGTARAFVLAAPPGDAQLLWALSLCCCRRCHDSLALPRPRVPTSSSAPARSLGRRSWGCQGQPFGARAQVGPDLGSLKALGAKPSRPARVARHFSRGVLLHLSGCPFFALENESFIPGTLCASIVE